MMVFNHIENQGRRIDEEAIESIHGVVGKSVGHQFFIVAPKGVFDFQQDYIDVDGIRYYALRIPYSIINELHRREFTALKQPNDETAVNETVDAIGFDFIQTPDVKWILKPLRKNGNDDIVCLTIESFESRARLRGRDTIGGFETLSMIMFDFDYNEPIFNMDDVVYAHEIKNKDWQINLSLAQLKKKTMIIFIDIYGNEAREIIEGGIVESSKM